MSKQYLELVKELTQNVVREHAFAVDKSGEFPKASIDAFLASPLAGLLNGTAVGGMGLGLRQATKVVEQIAQYCGSTAMIVTMHYAGATVIEKLGTENARRDIATGKHLSTLAFSERGSRSHFWVSDCTAEKHPKGIKLNGEKSWVTSSGHATAFVWSSKPVDGDELSTLWLVPRESAGLLPSTDAFDGIGLRGNDSRPVTAKDVIIPDDNRLGEHGDGFKIMTETVLPSFNALIASVAVGIMEAATTATATYASGTKLEHLGSPLAELPTMRAYIARMRCKTDMARALLLDTVSALEVGREDAMLRVLQSKAVCGEAATEVADLAMRVCGGAAFRKDVGVDRHFRDAHASTVMAPTTDQLYDFIGKAACGMDLF